MNTVWNEPTPLADSTALLAPTLSMLRSPRIFLAEADAMVRASLARLLEREGYDVDSGGRVETCLTLVGEADYDLVIADERSLGAAGLDLLEDVRRRDWSTPLVLVTGTADALVQEQAEGLGAHVIDEPFDREDLLSLVTALVPPRPWARRGGRAA